MFFARARKFLAVVAVLIVFRKYLQVHILYSVEIVAILRLTGVHLIFYCVLSATDRLCIDYFEIWTIVNSQAAN